MSVLLTKDLTGISEFKAGDVFVTDKALARMKDEPQFYEFVTGSLAKYIEKDWGDTPFDNKTVNDVSSQNGGDILAYYIYPRTNEKILIFTRQSEPCTKILLFSETDNANDYERN